MDEPTRALRDAAEAVEQALDSVPVTGTAVGFAVRALRSARVAFDAAHPAGEAPGPERIARMVKALLRIQLTAAECLNAYGDEAVVDAAYVHRVAAQGLASSKLPVNAQPRAGELATDTATANADPRPGSAKTPNPTTGSGFYYQPRNLLPAPLRTEVDRLRAEMADARARLSLLDGTHARYRVQQVNGETFAGDEDEDDGERWVVANQYTSERLHRGEWTTSQAQIFPTAAAAIDALLAVDPQALS